MQEKSFTEIHDIIAYPAFQVKFKKQNEFWKKDVRKIKEKIEQMLHFWTIYVKIQKNHE